MIYKPKIITIIHTQKTQNAEIAKTQKEKKKERKREREREREEEEEEEEEMEMQAQDLKPSTRVEATHANLKPTHPWSHADLKPPTSISDFFSVVLPYRIDHTDIEVSDATAPTPCFRK